MLPTVFRKIIWLLTYVPAGMTPESVDTGPGRITFWRSLNACWWSFVAPGGSSMMKAGAGFRAPEHLKKTPLNPDPNPSQLEVNEYVDRSRRLNLNASPNSYRRAVYIADDGFRHYRTMLFD